MTQFAPVAPLGLLEQLDEAETLGNYQLVIAPIVLEQAEEYGEFFQRHDDQFVIVDNGVIELGYPLDARKLHEAAVIVGAQLVVMPDTIDDARMTCKQTKAGLEAYRHYDLTTDTMGVVQGRTFAECIACAATLVEIGVDWLGVPRGLTPNLGSRVTLVKSLGGAFGKPMHVLGFSENIADDIEAALASPLVRGMDAATPVWLGFPQDPINVTGLGSKMPEYVTPLGSLLPWQPPTVANYGRRPTDYWRIKHVVQAYHMIGNVQRVRGWLDPLAAKTAHTARVEPLDPADQ